MHEQSCFADVNLSIFAVLVAVAVVVSWTSQIMKKVGAEPRWFTSYL